MLAPLFFALTTLLSGCAFTQNPQLEVSELVANTYTVRNGDTLSEVARKLGVTVSALTCYNEIVDQDRIYTGQVLRIPADFGAASLQSGNAVEAQACPKLACKLQCRGAVTSKRSSQYVAHVRHHQRVPRQTESQRVVPAQRYREPVYFLRPVFGPVISNFGATGSGYRNDGINIAAAEGASIRAAAAGTVAYTGNELRGYGNLVMIRHDDDYVTVYCHAKRIVVNRGDRVETGQIIGYVGATGHVPRPQLHFEIRHDTIPVDPKPLLVAFNRALLN